MDTSEGNTDNGSASRVTRAGEDHEVKVYKSQWYMSNYSINK